MVESLAYNATLQHLDLSENNLGPEVGIAIAQMLHLRYNITHLNLAMNKLGSRGIGAIGEALKVNEVLRFY